MTTNGLQAITRFTGNDRWLSNFWDFAPHVIRRGEMTFTTVEHAYQWSKTDDPQAQQWIVTAPTPAIAKRCGRLAVCRLEWDEMKVTVMRELLRDKFAEPTLRARLCATAPLALVEGNTWNDTYWGVCHGVGENWLGRLLMQVREEIG